MDVLDVRWQMGLSLAFHLVFAVIGMVMPVMMVAAEVAWLRTQRPEYLDLAKRWARGTAILFAVGAVSGTVLSLELGYYGRRSESGRLHPQPTIAAGNLSSGAGALGQTYGGMSIWCRSVRRINRGRVQAGANRRQRHACNGDCQGNEGVRSWCHAR